MCAMFPLITFYFLDTLEWKEDYTILTEVKLLFQFVVSEICHNYVVRISKKYFGD